MGKERHKSLQYKSEINHMWGVSMLLAESRQSCHTWLCVKGNAPSSEALISPFNAGFMLFPYYLLIFMRKSPTKCLMVKDFVRKRPQCCYCIWIRMLWNIEAAHDTRSLLFYTFSCCRYSLYFPIITYIMMWNLTLIWHCSLLIYWSPNNMNV